MSVREYIGARYVPLFADPIDWSKEETYTPLTIVCHGGNSYTSRQYVPKGVDITNDKFWALTGNYNAQIEQYRKEVAAYDDRITAAQNEADNALSLAQTNENDIATLDSEMAGSADSGLKTLITAEASARAEADTTLSAKLDTETAERKAADAAISAKVNGLEKLRSRNLQTSRVVLVGDSYLRGVGSSDSNGWGYYLNNYLNFAEVNIFGNSGAGFTAKGHSDPFNDMTFTQQVDYAATHVTDPATIDLVIIGGGWNDHESSRGTCKDAAISCAKNAQNKFANAHIVIVPMLNERHDLSAGYINAASGISQACNAGWSVPADSWEWLMSESDVSSSDGIHPGNEGYKLLGGKLASFISGGTPALSASGLGAGTEISSNLTSNTIRTSIYDGIVQITGTATADFSMNGDVMQLPKSMYPNAGMYIPAQLYSSSFKDIAFLYISSSGSVSLKKPISGSWPAGSATLYMPPIRYNPNI